MTVKELIEHLSKMPQDATVVYACCSEYEVMDEEHVTSSGDVAKTVFGRKERFAEGSKGVVRFIERDGHIVTYRPEQWDKAVDGEPKFLQLVTFPGN